VLDHGCILLQAFRSTSATLPEAQEDAVTTGTPGYVKVGWKQNIPNNLDPPNDTPKMASKQFKTDCFDTP